MSGFRFIPAFSHQGKTQSRKAEEQHWRLMRCWPALALDNTIGILRHYPEKGKDIFSAEEIEGLSALGDVLKQIRVRLKREGFVIQNGEIYKKPDIMSTYETGENP